ncbi:hypothetical protein FOPG_11080 [Fusarium oxysporum f. sp. conglutinans race 2 54008]|uniref:Uncharacterized protein n=1 Tax=Fusarium oxysporum f. sp. conglutinans race 2 54008 TaxID=1089457 RepID=X0HP75_FUSOX|nr:hypothetical protein FOPG_11080 [Fusarium oxysporum f. sp. conglutinans race 2 54008]
MAVSLCSENRPASDALLYVWCDGVLGGMGSSGFPELLATP